MTNNKQENTSTIKNVAQIVKKRGISPIWFLPIFAALVGIWLLFNNVAHTKEEITIHFETADSIIVHKTRIRYKGVIVGTVKKIELNREGGVNVIASIESDAIFMLRTKTKFWLVSPKASLTAITGLDTVFTGSYINILPGEGAAENDFIATTEQPISIPDNALLVSLSSKNAGAISDGTPLFYKKIKVGKVVRVRLDKDGQFVHIRAFVTKKYSHLIKEDSKFWNISGLTANISQAGLNVKLDSLTSLIAGGITFSSPQKSKNIDSNSEHKYRLFDDIEQAEAGLNIELLLSNITNLPEGAGIIFKGLGIGKVTKIKYLTQEKQFIATATINPQFANMVTKNAQFWLEKTSLSFSKMKNLGNIITGDYIAFLPSETNEDSPAATRFIVQEAQKPAIESVVLKLITEDATGLSAGTPVSYQGIKIGNISALSFASNGRFIETSINIEKKYQYLVNKHSQFYLLSGLQVKGSLLKGIEVQTTPVENMLSGGIGLYNKFPVTQKNKALKDDAKFRLYPSKSMAKLGKNVFSAPKTIYITSKLLPSVSEGSPVYYHKFPIGEVTSFSIDKSGSMHTKLSIKGQYKHLINNKSIFWNVSGLKVNAGLSGVKIEADSLLSIAAGGIAVEQGNASVKNKDANGHYKLFDSFAQATQNPTDITLTFDQAYDLQVGSKLRLKGLTIGKITSLTLNNKSKIEASLQIDEKFAKEVARKGSRFWIVRSDLSLSGAKNLGTLISGVYLNVLPGKGTKKIHFEGESDEPTLAIKNIGLPIILLAVNAGSTSIGSPVYHRQIQIGEVTAKKLTKKADGVKIILNIYPQYAHLIRSNSIFWPASGFNLDIGITGAALKSTSLASILKGGVNMTTTDKEALQPAAQAYAKYKIQLEIDEDWLDWQLAIPSKY